MRKTTVLRLEMPFREPLVIRGFEYGDADAPLSCAIVGSLRGDEFQQAYICARLVSRLEELEAHGGVRPGRRLLVIPCANPHTMNVESRFWPADGSDVNRSFPGDVGGEATERIAAGIMEAIRGAAYGIQLASFNQRGNFVPHVRVTRTGQVSEESLELAADFRLPFVVSRDPSPFDTSLLNYSWQEGGTHAFSVYATHMHTLDERDARTVEGAIMRFLAARGLVGGTTRGGVESQRIDEADLADVRTEHEAGFFVALARPGDHVLAGQEVARVLDSHDARVVESLTSPIAGRVFFTRVQSLVQQRMIAMRVAPEA